MHSYKSLLGVLIGLIALVLTACGPHEYTGSVIDPPKPTADWTLTDYNGQPFQLSAQRGNVTLLYFGYTNCPDFCPTTLGDWKLVKQSLGADAERVRFVMISVDPERDTEAALKQYVSTFDPSFVGLRPTADQLEALSRDYGVGVDSNALMTDHEHAATRHGTYTYAIDPQGQVRVLFAFGTDPNKIAADVQELLRS